MEKAARLLRVLAESPVRLAPSSLPRELGFSRAATHRLLRALEKNGFVRRDSESDAFVLAFRLVEMVMSHHRRKQRAVALALEPLSAKRTRRSSRPGRRLPFLPTMSVIPGTPTATPSG